MKSPFPGMDPFIEACGLWEDFHVHLIDEISRSLADRVPDRYIVRSGERNYLEFADEAVIKQRPFKPNVTINALTESALLAEESVAVAEPGELTMRAYIEEEFREPFVEILDGDSDSRLVTCIEILSPSNKRPHSTGWEQYLRKRRGLLQGGKTHLVEIDLLRGGERMPMADPWPTSPYTILIARAAHTPLCKVRPAYFRQAVTAIPVPLLKPDPDLSVELQPMIDAIYTRYKYWRSIDYAKPIAPPLTAQETAWLQERLRERAG